MTRLIRTLVLAMLCGGLAALPATAQPPLQAQINALQAQIDALQQAQIDQFNNALQGQVAQMAALQQAHMAQVATLQSQIAGVAADIPDCMTTASGAGSVDDVVFSGCNVHVQNSLGDYFTNSKGNLIIGYNEDDVFIDSDHPTYGGNARYGSHNLVIGPEHSYSTNGGLLAGFANTIANPDGIASVSGGTGNTASGQFASVSGGKNNEASGEWASVSGGANNMAKTGGDDITSISGGYGNEASGSWASVSGGINNTASGQSASVSGGKENVASGEVSSVSGGESNETNNTGASVSGGGGNTASADFHASVSGGSSNEASGDFSSVSGGDNRTASGSAWGSWAAGGLSQPH